MKPKSTLHNASHPERRDLLSSIVLLAGAFFAATAGAAGFGELTLHSRIGENLRAEVPLLGIGKELTDPACYVLAPNPGSDLPVITNARLQLLRSKDGYRLLIVGSRPIAEPVFAISLRANCGIDLRHDYVLMPDAPMLPAQLTDSAGRRDHEEMATERPAPAKKKQRASAGSRDNARASPGREKTRLTSQAAPRPAEQTGDRLTLSTAPLDLPVGDSAFQAKAAELEERLLKMESTLHSLNQQIETLDTSLKLSTEMQSARQELQTAQNMQPAAATPPATAARESSSGDWLELLVSSLLGGSLAVGIAAYLGRHKQPNRPII